MADRRRRVEVPRWPLPAFCSLLLVGCVALGLAFRASLTNYGGLDSGLLDSVMFSAACCQPERLAIVGDAEIEAAASELYGDGNVTLAPSDVGELLGITRSAFLADHDLVVTGFYTGESFYAYQAFVCHFEITAVICGSAEAGVFPGDVISVYEGLAIVEPENYTGKGQFLSERMVIPMGSGPSSLGLAPFEAGRGYLLVLDSKSYPSTVDEDSREQRWGLANSVYARVALDAPAHPERIWVNDGASTTRVRMPLSEARTYDVFVLSQDDVGGYLAGCEEVLSSAGL